MTPPGTPAPWAVAVAKALFPKGCTEDSYQRDAKLRAAWKKHWEEKALVIMQHAPAEPGEDTQRLDWLLQLIHDKGTDGIGELNWTPGTEEDGTEDDFMFDRQAIDAARQAAPPVAGREET